MATAESDFTSLVDTSATTAATYLADQHPLVVRALQGLAAYFVQAFKAAGGTEPTDVLSGIAFGTTTNHFMWRVMAVGTGLLIQENTGTEGTPTWTTRAEFPTAAGIVSAHAASHQNSGADEVATATAAANVIPKAGAGGTLADGFIAETNVTQHEGAIDHDALTNHVADEHLDWKTDRGADNIAVENITAVPEAAVTAHEGAIDHDALTNMDAAEHYDWTADQGANNVNVANVPNAVDADTVDSVHAAAMGQLAVAAEWSKAQGHTEVTTGSAAGTYAPDFDASNYFECTLTENITTITPANLTKPGTRVILFIQAAGSAFTIAGWDGAIKWAGDVAPTMPAGFDDELIVTILVKSDGAMRGVFSSDITI